MTDLTKLVAAIKPTFGCEIPAEFSDRHDHLEELLSLVASPVPPGVDLHAVLSFRAALFGLEIDKTDPLPTHPNISQFAEQFRSPFDHLLARVHTEVIDI